MSQKVMDVLDAAARQFGDKPALKVKRNGQWETTTWKQYRQEVRFVARGFMKLGLEPKQGVAIIGYNCPEWFEADLGAITAGGVPAGIYTTSTAEQCQYIANHCEAAIAVVENTDQLAKFLKIRDQLPLLKAIVLIYGNSSAPGVYSWQQLRQMGEEVSEAELDERIKNQQPDDLCTLIYTSGTTGPPKAVMISHTNLTWTAKAGLDSLKITEGEQTVSYLPLSHIAEQIVSMHGPMHVGVTVWFAESLEKLKDNLVEVRPDYFLGVPRVWEKMQAGIQAKGAKNPWALRKLSAWARKVGLEGGYARQNGKPLPATYGLAEKLVFSKVRKALGLDRCRIQVTSAAPISRDTLDFFLSLGIPLYEVFGMSECTGPATISGPDKFRTGKCGIPLPGTEVKIFPDGEICMRGNHVFKGYYKNPEATAEAIDAEGWLHSGDIGTIDSEGFLQITDRKKDLLITAGGENIAPQVIEGELKSITVVNQAVVVGDAKKYLAALFTIDPDKLRMVAAQQGMVVESVESAIRSEQFKTYLQKEINRVNDSLARVQTIKKWAIIPGEFSIDGGELTPTMKIKRKVIREKYAKEIDGLYVE